MSFTLLCFKTGHVDNNHHPHQTEVELLLQDGPSGCGVQD
ncbi:hypothetical protein GBAR_LOCUS27834 [Geodia barretti]|nr:hypothetical protein GBAR_LOCUS27834 [Geodia barretti]